MRHRRRRRNPVSDTAKILIGLGVVAGIGTAIFFAMKPAAAAENQLPASDVAEKAAAVKAAVDAAVKAAAEAAATERHKTGINVAAAAFKLANDMLVASNQGLSVAQIYSQAFSRATEAVLAIGVPPVEVRGIVRDAVVAFLMSAGYSQSPAEAYAMQAQKDAGM